MWRVKDFNTGHCDMLQHTAFTDGEEMRWAYYVGLLKGYW